MMALALATAHLNTGTADAIAPVPQVRQVTQAAAELQEDDLLLFSVTLQQLTLSEALTAYGDPADPFLPVGELSRLFDLDITVSPSQQRITGTIGEARRPLTIDIPIGVSKVAGRNLPLTPADVGFTPADIYVRASILGQFLSARFVVDPEALTIAVEPSEKLPVQARLERIATIRGLSPNFAAAMEPALRIRAPYQLFSPPAFDTVLQVGRDTRTRETYSRRYEVRFASDLAYTNIQGFVGSDDRGQPSSARILLERRSNEGDLPLGATRISGGDVYTPSLAVGPRSVSGRGVSFTNIPLEETSVFRTIDLRGELPAGFEAELYINDVLRSGQTSAVQGRYEFLNVPLVRGLNVIRIVIYGLRGERTELVRIVNVGSGQLRKGDLRYDFGAVQGGRDVLNLGSDSVDVQSRGTRVVGGLWYGLTDQLTLATAVALYAPSGSRRAAAIAGVRTSIAGLAIQADGAADNHNGRALSFGVAGQPLGIATVLRHAEYRGGFLDETAAAFNFSRPLKRHTSLTFDFALPRIFGRSVPLSLRGLRNEFADGGSNLVASARASTAIAGALVSTGLDYQLDKHPKSEDQERLTGNLAISKFVNFKWQLRASADYDLLPDARLRAAAFTADRSLSDRLSFRLGVGRTFSEQRDTYAQAGAVLRLPIGDLALSGDYSFRNSDWGLSLRFGFGSLFDPGRRRYVMTPPGPASGGSAIFRAFIDRDGDGNFGPGDEPASRIALQGGDRKVITDARGRAVVTGLGTAPTGSISVNTEDVDDIYFRAPASRVEFSPRPGQVLAINYPLSPVGEVYARLVTHRGGEQSIGLSAVQVRLVRDGKEPLLGVTEYDGSVVFTEVPLGSYRLELDPAQAERLGMRLTSEPTITVESDRDVQVNATVEFVGGAGGRAGETPDGHLKQ